jgi:hypothetical protein
VSGTGYQYTPRPYVILLVMTAIILTGCSTSSRSLRYTQPEVRLIPSMAMHKVLTPGSNNQVVVIRAEGLSDLAVVEGFEGDDTVVVRDERGTVSKIAINVITDIYRVTHFDTENEQEGKRRGSAAATVGETMIYAPLVPVAVVSWPFLRAMGLDEHKNSNDREKALVIYGGMTKQDLHKAIGEPDNRYRCHRKDSSDWFDIWNYDRDKVLYGGQYLFFSEKDGEVYFSSFRYPSWANCELQ